MKITVKIYPQNNEELSQLSELLSKLKMSSKLEQSAADQKVYKSIKTEVEIPKVEIPKVKVETPKVKVETDSKDTAINLESIRAMVQTKIQKGHRDLVKAALEKFEASNVSALLPENFIEFYNIVKDLK